MEGDGEEHGGQRGKGLLAKCNRMCRKLEERKLDWENQEREIKNRRICEKAFLKTNYVCQAQICRDRLYFCLLY